MESIPERTSQEPEEVGRPRPKGRVGRVSEQTKGLADDLRAWVELKVRLTQLEVEEKIEARLNRVVVGVLVGVTAGLAAFFALVTLSLGLGAWLNHPAWGFLITTGLLALLAIVLRLVRPQLVRMRAERIGVKANPPSENGRATS